MSSVFFHESLIVALSNLGGVEKPSVGRHRAKGKPQCHFENSKTPSQSCPQMNSRNFANGFWTLIPHSLTNASKPTHETDGWIRLPMQQFAIMRLAD